MVRAISLIAALAGCSPPEPTDSTAEPIDVAAPVGEQRVSLVVARVPDALAQPVLAELGSPAIGLLAARHRIDPGWHIYWRNPGESGLATRLTPTPEAGTELGEALMPAPDRFEHSFGWETEAILFIPILAGSGAASVRSKWVACQVDACVAGESNASSSGESADDPTLRAMLDRLPRPIGDRLAGHAWSRTDEGVTLALTLSAGASQPDFAFFPDATDPGLFFVESTFDSAAQTASIDWRVGSPGHELPSTQGVIGLTDTSSTRYYELALRWPQAQP